MSSRLSPYIFNFGVQYLKVVLLGSFRHAAVYLRHGVLQFTSSFNQCIFLCWTGFIFCSESHELQHIHSVSPTAEVKFILWLNFQISALFLEGGENPTKNQNMNNQHKETPTLPERQKGFNCIRTAAKSQPSRGTGIADALSHQTSLSAITFSFWELGAGAECWWCTD